MTTVLQIGDGLWRIISGTIFVHYGVVIGFRNGMPLIIENQKGIRVRVVDYETFAKGKVVNVEKRPHDRTWEYIGRASEAIAGKMSYKFFDWNCEHLKNFIQTGESKAPQIGGGIAILGLAALYIFARE